MRQVLLLDDDPFNIKTTGGGLFPAIQVDEKQGFKLRPAIAKLEAIIEAKYSAPAREDMLRSDAEYGAQAQAILVRSARERRPTAPEPEGISGSSDFPVKLSLQPALSTSGSMPSVSSTAGGHREARAMIEGIIGDS